MKKIKIGRRITASKIAYGCMRIGDKTEIEAEKAVRTAFDAGIDFFDNADIYCSGKSEELFGKAIKGINRERVKVQSKCGIRKGFYDFSKEHIISSVENSVKRMDCEFLDVLCLHRPDVLFNGEDIAEAFENLYSRGLVKNFGVSNFSPMQTELLKKYISYPLIVNQLQLGIFHTGMIDSGMCVNMKNEFAKDSDGSVLPYCRLNDMVIQAWSPMRSANGFFPEDSSAADKIPVLERWGAEYGVSKEALAIAFINRMDFVQPIIGTTNPKRINDLISADQAEISKKDWYAIYSEMGNIVP